MQFFFFFKKMVGKELTFVGLLLSAMSILAILSSISYFYLTQSSQQLQFTDENTKATKFK